MRRTSLQGRGGLAKPSWLPGHSGRKQRSLSRLHWSAHRFSWMSRLVLTIFQWLRRIDHHRRFAIFGHDENVAFRDKLGDSPEAPPRLAHGYDRYHCAAPGLSCPSCSGQSVFTHLPAICLPGAPHSSQIFSDSSAASLTAPSQ